MRDRLRSIAPATWLSVTLICLGTAFSLALRGNLPLNPDSFEHGYFDDALFPKLATAIVRGDWLGDFDKTTLAKGSGYPMFIAVAKKAGIPLLIAHHLAYLAAAGTCAAAVGMVTRRVALAAAVYLVLAFDPTNFNASASTIAREFLATPAALFAVSGFFVVVYGALHWRRRWLAIALAPFVGLATGILALTREETLWVAPSFGLVVVLLVVVRIWRTPLRGRVLPILLWPALVLIVVAATFQAPIEFVKHRNERFYGERITSDLSTGEFARAYAAMTRVRGVPLRDFVPVNRRQRELVYSVSPSARILRPVLESPDNGWKQWECPDYGPCDDYPGGGAPWAFRDAAEATGWFDNESEFQTLFGRIARDVERACASGRLRCSRRLPASLQLVQRAEVGPVLRKATNRFGVLVGPHAADPFFDEDALYEVPNWQRRELRRHILVGVPATQAAAERRARAIADEVGPVDVLRLAYGWLFVPVGLIAIAVHAWFGWRKQALRPVLVLGAALVAGAVARLVVFAIVETTQYWIHPHARYDLPTRAFLLAFVAVGAVVAVDLWQERRSSKGLAAAGDRLEA